jgi:hypothetical protein
MSDDNNDNLDAAMDKVAETLVPTRAKSTGAKNGEAAQAQVIIRTTDEERERWKDAAAKAGMSMSEWLRGLASKEATSVLECDHPMHMRLSYPWAEFCLKCTKRLRG